jgi:hypothetical protein
MMDWGLDLFEDLSAVCISLQIEPDSGASDDWKTYVSRYREWRHTSHESELVDGVFIWETSREKEPALFALDPDHMRLRGVSVTDKLRPLLSRLARDSSSLEVALQSWRSPDGSGTETASPRPAPGQKSTIGWQFDPHIPAIVHPIVHYPLPADADRLRVTERVDWIVVLVSADALRRQILPELTRQHFGGVGGAPKYSLEILAPTWPAGVLYSSRGQGRHESETVTAVDTPDAEMNIFGPPPSGIGDHPLQSAITEVSIRHPSGFR